MARWLVICVLLAAPAAWAKGKTKARSQRGPDVVACEFGWPSSLSAAVGYRWTRTKKMKPAYDIPLTARMVMAPDGAGLRVEFRDWTDAVAGGASGGPSLSARQWPAIIVDKKGAFVRVDGTVGADDEIRFATEHAIPNAGPEGRKLLGEVLPVLGKDRAARTWQNLVESWAGAKLEIGANYEMDSEAPSPLLPGETLKSRVRIRAERRLDCPGDAGKRCVELTMRSEPDRESLARLTQKLLAKFGVKELPPGTAVSAVVELTLVTEPDRLIPHRLEVTKAVGPRNSDQAGQVDHTTWTFDYPRGP